MKKFRNFFFQKNMTMKKHTFWKYLENYSIIFPDFFCSPIGKFKNKIFSDNMTAKNRKNRRKKKVVRSFLKNKNFKIFRVFNRKCLKNCFVGLRNNEEKLLSSFRDISEKDVFFDLQTRHHTIHHPSLQVGAGAWYPGGWSNRLGH